MKLKSLEYKFKKNSMKDLAPSIYRQRLIIEGIPKEPISNTEIEEYLTKLSVVLKMKILLTPITHLSSKFGWAGWVHWESSGAHFYAWDQPMLFFSVDIYTCKKFDNQAAVEFTKDFFKASKLEYRSL